MSADVCSVHCTTAVSVTLSFVCSCSNAQLPEYKWKHFVNVNGISQFCKAFVGLLASFMRMTTTTCQWIDRKVLELVYKSSLFRFIDFFHSMGFQVLEAIVVKVNEVKYIYKWSSTI